MNILPSGGGMKLNHQSGQAHALISHGIRPSTIYCESSGIVVASLTSALHELLEFPLPGAYIIPYGFKTPSTLLAFVCAAAQQQAFAGLA